MPISYILLAGIGGFIGSIARFLMSGIVNSNYENKFPFGTLAVNVLGSLLIGFLFSCFEGAIFSSERSRIFLISGILGGFTTFSAFSFETFQLAKDGLLLLAFSNIAAQLVFGMLAVYFGYLLGKII